MRTINTKTKKKVHSNMKRVFLTLLLLVSALPLMAQLYHPGEVLDYRVSYKAKMFPNTEVGMVRVDTKEVMLEGEKRLAVTGYAKTMPAYRLFFRLEDRYTVYIDPERLIPVRFESDLKEGDYTYESQMDYDWDSLRVKTRWSSRKRPVKTREMAIEKNSLDAISLFFSMRSAQADQFTEGKVESMRMLLPDTIRTIHYRYIGREVKKIRNMGKFKTLRFECELGSSEGFSFTDGTVFTIWISDDENKIPLYIESPIRIGSIQAYVSKIKGTKYPLKSKIR